MGTNGHTHVVSIRAYNAQEMFRKELYQRNNRFTRVNRELWNLNRWIGVHTDVFAGIFCASLAAYLIYGADMDSPRIGFSLSMAGTYPPLSYGYQGIEYF